MPPLFCLDVQASARLPAASICSGKSEGMAVGLKRCVAGTTDQRLWLFEGKRTVRGMEMDAGSMVTSRPQGPSSAKDRVTFLPRGCRQGLLLWEETQADKRRNSRSSSIPTQYRRLLLSSLFKDLHGKNSGSSHFTNVCGVKHRVGARPRPSKISGAAAQP